MESASFVGRREGNKTTRHIKDLALYFSPRQKAGQEITGYELLAELVGKDIADANDLEYFKQHPQDIPKDFERDEATNEPLYLCFFGTTYERPPSREKKADRRLFIRCLYKTKTEEESRQKMQYLTGEGQGSPHPSQWCDITVYLRESFSPNHAAVIWTPRS